MPAPTRGESPQADPRQSSLVDQLTEYVLAQLKQPQPAPPQPAQPQALTPSAALATARNPQFANQLYGMAQAPEQARFSGQQAAFEQAMAGRKEAFGLAGPLLQYEKATGSGLGRGALAIIEEGGVRRTVNVTRDATGRIVDVQEVGPTPWTPGNIPGIPGVSPPMTFPRRGSAPGAAAPIPGAPTPPAPPSQEEDYRKNAVFIQGANHLRQAFRELKSATADSGIVSNIVGQEAGETKYGGVLAPAYNKFESELRTTLDTMIVAVTGLSFPEQAFRRYRSELPVATDTEQQAMQKIDNVVRKFIAEVGIQRKTYPGIGGGEPGGEDPAMQRARELLRQHRGQP
jgi:hypothetical protein